VLRDNRVRRLIGLSESFADASNSLSSAESSKIDTNVSAQLTSKYVHGRLFLVRWRRFTLMKWGSFRRPPPNTIICRQVILKTHSRIKGLKKVRLATPTSPLSRSLVTPQSGVPRLLH